MRLDIGRGDLKHAKENLAKASHVDMMLYVVLGGGNVERVNFRRSDLKQAKGNPTRVSYVDMMLYVVSGGGIRVGKERFETIILEKGIWKRLKDLS